MREVLIAVLMISGVLLMLVAAIGLSRLPDPLCRAHAVAKAVSLGIALILLGAWVALGTAGAGFKLILAIVFQLATIPVASHLLAQAALQLNLPRWRPPGRTNDDPQGATEASTSSTRSPAANEP